MMKRIYSIFVLLILFLSVEAQEYFDVFLCIGQSNMAGRGIMEAGDNEPVEGVFILGPEDTPVPATANANIYSTIRKHTGMQRYNLCVPFAQKIYRTTGRPVLLVVNARGGTRLAQWQKDAQCFTFNANEGDDSEKIGSPIPQFYSEAVRRCRAAMQYGSLKGILWHQGCGDSDLKRRETYMDRLSDMVASLRADLGVGEEVPFILGEVFHGGDGAPINPSLSQVGWFIPNSFCVSADGCSSNKDNLHFSREALIKLSERYADAILEPRRPICYFKARNPFLHQWIMYPSKTLEQLPDIPEPDKLNKWGSLAKGPSFEATGFFRTEFYNGRWIMVDPEGHMHIDAGICHIIMGNGEIHKTAFSSKYKNNEKKWFKDARRVMSDAGFNGSGAFSDERLIREWNKSHPGKPFTYCVNINVLKNYTWKKSKKCPELPKALPVFDSGFEDFARKQITTLASSLKDDPALIGYFSDNELDFSKNCLDDYLSLPLEAEGRQAALKWLSDKGVDVSEIDDDLRSEFLGFVARTYFSMMRNLFKSMDANHLYLGDRLHGDVKFYEPVIRAAGEFCDILSFNYYSDWCVRPEEVTKWQEWSGRPFIITEFYTKAEDSGLANTRGAGWRVPSQRERAGFYQNFVLSLLESGSCVGWHWFKYQDNDPTDKTMDPTNIDANKGIVDNSYEPYGVLLEAMREVNIRRYSLLFPKNR